MGQGAPATRGQARAVAVQAHLGEILQGRLGPQGPIALVTLPCPVLRVHGLWRPGPFALSQIGCAIVSRAQTAALLRHLGRPVTGHFTLRAEMPPGGGAGSSTAALMAIAQLAGQGGDLSRDLADAAIAVEGASDPLMFSSPARLLWASREGRILGHLPPLPRFEVLGGFFGPMVRTDPKDTQFPDIADLAEALPQAMRSAAHLAAIASESATRALEARGQRGDPAAQLARDLGALGYAIGHTGPARGLIFAPGTVPRHAKAALHEVGFRHMMQFRPAA